MLVELSTPAQHPVVTIVGADGLPVNLNPVVAPVVSTGFVQRRGILGTAAIANNTAYWLNWVLPPRTQLAKVGVGVSVAGAVGSIIRHAFYSVAATGLPGALLLDAGSQDATQAADTEAIMIPSALTVPDSGTFWSMHVAQWTGSGPTVRTYTSGDPVPVPSIPGTSIRNCLNSTVAGAPPDPAPTSGYTVGATALWVILKVA